MPSARRPCAPLLPLLAGLLIMPLGGCAMLNSFLDPTTLGSFPVEYREGGIRRVLTPRETPPGLANSTEPTPEDLVPVYADYRLGPGDQVGISIEDLTATGAIEAAGHEISPTGYIRLPLLGSIKVSGMTEQELEQELTSQLKERQLLPDPIVRVFIQLKRQMIYTIIGSVSQAGPYPITEPDFRLLDAIGLARDITPSVKKLYVIRRDGAKNGTQTSEPYEQTGTGNGLVIPPPTDDEPEDRAPASFRSFLSPEGVGQDQPQSQPQPNEDLEAIIAPGRRPTTTGARPANTEALFPPLVYDPETGNPIAVKPEKTDEELETPPERTTEAPPKQPGFEWDDVPEYESTQRVIEIDVDSLRNGDSRQNIVIRNRDVINVPVDIGVFYLMGEINRPGVYGLGGRDITIKHAIAIGGGLTPLAWPQRCEIIRHEPGTDKQITIPVNVDAIFAGLEDDVLLKDDDIVNMGTHFVAPFLYVIRNSFRFTYGFGFVYDRNFADQDAYGGRANPEAVEAARKASRGLPF